MEDKKDNFYFDGGMCVWNMEQAKVKLLGVF